MNMNKRLRETFALILTITVTFISFVVAIPAQAQTSLSSSSIIALANTDRAKSSAGSLTEDVRLDHAAQLKANDMAAKSYFSHIDPSGNAPWMWFKKVGYYYWSAGENLAINFSDAPTLNSAWMNSPTHKANIVNSGYSRVGIGIAHGTYQGRPATYIVEFFAKPYISSLARR
jgi:uncharacterized protein YkwD